MAKHLIPKGGEVEASLLSDRGGSEVVKAVAITTSTTIAPRVSTKGESYEAEDIVLLAKHFGIPVVVSNSLARDLYPLPKGARVPYAMLEVLVQVIRSLERRINSLCFH